MSYLSALVTASDALATLWNWHSGNPEKPLDIKQIAINPMAGMTQLALLYHHPEGTKFDFANHQITFFEPIVGQGAQRKLSGSSRDIVLKLEPLISIALQWYQPRENLKVQKIFLRTIRGLKVLKKTYKISDMVNLHIDGYIKDIAEACLRGIPKKDPVNPYQQRVFELGLVEVNRVTEILDEFPGDFTVFESEQKWDEEQHEFPEQGSGGVTNSGRSSIGRRNVPTGSEKGSAENSVNLPVAITEPETKSQDESGSPRLEKVAESFTEVKTKKGAKKDHGNVQGKEKTTGSSDKHHGSAQSKEEPVVNTGQNQASTQIKENKNAPVSVPVITEEDNALKLAAYKEQQRKLCEEAYRKLMEDDVVPHIPSPDKMSKINDYLKGEVATFSKIAQEAVINLLLFKQ